MTVKVRPYKRSKREGWEVDICVNLPNGEEVRERRRAPVSTKSQAQRWGDVDLVRGELHIRRADWKGIESTPKGGRGRSVELTKRLAAAARGSRSILRSRANPDTRTPSIRECRKSS